MPRRKKPTPTTTYLTVADLVERWQLSENTVKSTLATGALPVTRIGPDPDPHRRAMRVLLADVERYEADRTTGR